MTTTPDMKDYGGWKLKDVKKAASYHGKRSLTKSKKKRLRYAVFFYFPNYLLLFSFKHIIDIGRERNVMTLEKELGEIAKFLKKIKNINCVKQNKIFVVIDRKAMPEDVNNPPLRLKP